eukprot:1053360-Amphidinium_carterae.2
MHLLMTRGVRLPDLHWIQSMCMQTCTGSLDSKPESKASDLLEAGSLGGSWASWSESLKTLRHRQVAVFRQDDLC